MEMGKMSRADVVAAWERVTHRLDPFDKPVELAKAVAEADAMEPLDKRVDAFMEKDPELAAAIIQPYKLDLAACRAVSAAERARADELRDQWMRCERERVAARADVAHVLGEKTAGEGELLRWLNDARAERDSIIAQATEDLRASNEAIKDARRERDEAEGKLTACEKALEVWRKTSVDADARRCVERDQAIKERDEWRGLAGHRWALLEKAEKERDEARHAKGQMELRWQAAEQECERLKKAYTEMQRQLDQVPRYVLHPQTGKLLEMGKTVTVWVREDAVQQEVERLKADVASLQQECIDLGVQLRAAGAGWRPVPDSQGLRECRTCGSRRGERWAYTETVGAGLASEFKGEPLPDKPGPAWESVRGVSPGLYRCAKCKEYAVGGALGVLPQHGCEKCR